LTKRKIRELAIHSQKRRGKFLSVVNLEELQWLH
jgi:hypothetical protein